MREIASLAFLTTKNSTGSCAETRYKAAMKGTYFQRPLELSLKVNGESWKQGDAIEGTLVVRNHDSAAISVTNAQVYLAHADLKKVRQKNPGSFKIFSNVSLQFPNQVEAQHEIACDWRLATEQNSPITDKTSSLFLLYGLGDDVEKLGQLQVLMNPHALIQEFIKTITIQFRFVLKSQKFGKGYTEVKLTPPTAQGFASLDHVTLYFRFEGESLQVRSIFDVKKIEATAASFDMKKLKKEFSQTLAQNQLYLPSGRVNHESLETAIKAALELVESKVLF